MSCSASYFTRIVIRVNSIWSGHPWVSVYTHMACEPPPHLPPDVFFCCPYTHPPTSLSLSSASFFSPHFLFFRELLFYLFLSCGLERKGTHASEQTGPAFSLCTVPTIWCPCNTPIPPWLLTILCQKYSQVETDWNCFFKLTEVWLFINCALLFNPHFSLTITLTILFTLWFFFFFFPLLLQANLRKLMDLVQQNQVDKVAKMLERGLDPNHQDTDTGGKV